MWPPGSPSSASSSTGVRASRHGSPSAAVSRQSSIGSARTEFSDRSVACTARALALGARYAGASFLLVNHHTSGGPLDAVNHQYRLAARPVGLPKDTDWELTEEAVADPGEGEVLVKVKYLSLDPAMRGWMNDARSYIAPVELGAVMRAGAAGE